MSCPPSRSRERDRERERKADEVELESTPPFVPKASEAARNAPVRKWNSLKRQDKVSGLKRGRPIQGQGGRGEESAGPTPLPSPPCEARRPATIAAGGRARLPSSRAQDFVLLTHQALIFVLHTARTDERSGRHGHFDDRLPVPLRVFLRHGIPEEKERGVREHVKRVSPECPQNKTAREKR